MAEIPSSDTVSTKLQRIAKLARQMPETAITSLSHHIDIDWLKEAWRRTRKNAAVGVDGRTAEEYEQDLEANLQSLLSRAKSELVVRGGGRILGAWGRSDSRPRKGSSRTSLPVHCASSLRGGAAEVVAARQAALRASQPLA